MSIAPGSQADFIRRQRAILPQQWFPSPPALGENESAPTLVSILAGSSAQFANIWQLLTYTERQARISTATGPFLDLISVDFFGPGGLARNTNEADDSYRARIKAALFPLRSTRAAVSNKIQALTGVAPLIVEPRRPADTKGFGGVNAGAAGGGYGWGSTGLRYGSRLTPFQSFITVDNTTAKLPDATIFAAIDDVMPVAYVAWTQITEG